jgi:hypothetical protein
MKFKSLLLVFLAIVLLGIAATGQTQTVPVSTMDMHTDTVNITPGMTTAEIAFTV